MKRPYECLSNKKSVSVCACVTGLHIVYTQDEVDVVQNLMFYIEAAYKVAVSFHSVSVNKSTYK